MAKSDKHITLEIAKINKVTSLLTNAIEALAPLANIPLEETLYKHPDQPLMGWNGHMLYVRDVYTARNIIRNYEEMING